MTFSINLTRPGTRLKNNYELNAGRGEKRFEIASAYAIKNSSCCSPFVIRLHPTTNVKNHQATFINCFMRDPVIFLPRMCSVIN